MTEELFREDATLLECEARVLRVDDDGGIVLDRTVFYPLGGGQAGDSGEIEGSDGRRVTIADTRKRAAAEGGESDIVHLAAAGSELSWLQPGTSVRARIDAAKRRAHMRFHTATHLLCALVPHPVNGCSITAGYARLDFHMTEPLDKEALTAGIARLVAGAHPVRHRWISEEELDANPQLVRSMSVQPPRGLGRVRVKRSKTSTSSPAAAPMSRTPPRSARSSSRRSKRSQPRPAGSCSALPSRARARADFSGAATERERGV